MTERRTLSTPNAPPALGPYSQAVISAGLVHCSGQVALDPQSGELVSSEIGAQTERVLENLRAVLEAADSGLAAVIKCNIYLTDIADYAAVNEVYARFFSGDSPPARACVEVTRLPKDARVEIDCVAAL